VKAGSKYSCWTRWGRIGEDGQNSTQVCSNLAGAEDAFKKKFQDKTKNKWDNRHDFKPAKDKYTLIEVDHTEDAADEKPAAAAASSGSSSAKCTLEAKLQQTVQLIFNQDMFKDGMAQLGIDTDKMPLGKLSKTQVDKGGKVLEDLKAAIEANQKKKCEDFTSQYYTLIPHNFGRKAPPAITTLDQVHHEFDMLHTLGDIAVGVNASDASKTDAAAEHPDDVNYKALHATLKLLDPKSDDFKIIQKYTEETQGHRKCKVVDVFELDRAGEGERFKAHDKLGNRKLLWHGTSVPVVVAILKTGLRIMPHARGRVGSGLYFASENSKSAGYVGTTGDTSRWGCSAGTGYMFLVEVALGKENQIVRDNSSLKKAPDGYDCVHAMGATEPDPSKDTKMTFEGKEVAVPQGKPIQTEHSGKSSFSQSEYLIYKESQARIRYMLKMQF
jgi:poly [ADP-ribose] polymerase